MTPRQIFLFTVMLLLPLLSGCGNLGYYLQSAGGQLEMINATEPIEAILAEPDVEPGLADKLKQVLAIRSFASEQLQLPDNGSYRSYADLERPYAIWNVFAAPPLSLRPERWCFLIAGCVSYRGYFSEKDAREFADGLRQQGKDVYVAGISAYSTLGWFDDPMLNTIIQRAEPELAGLIFHELAHQQVYVQDDTEFNESFAMTVELEGTRAWLNHRQLGNAYDAYLARKSRRENFVTLVTGARKQLAAIYESDQSDADKLAGKAAIIDQLRQDYARIRKNGESSRWYDRWFAEEINNAKLNAIGEYHRFVPAFRKLRAQQKDWAGFYAAVRELGKMDKAERHARLDRIAADQ